ncbi:PREDICTED: insulinoma-associated protein 1a [Rhagoletis zephyria]|uniref:insulinoma-associated protein 1a n=1 Tax=Rhagoletis zephyria TaxID=28612 RepID=UPI0008112558|nr:PREDICTED: insulinoma-associated protein 1a [Rhagoletis zephyria]
MATITTTNTAAASAQHSIVQMASRQIPHGLGLLTTVASLPPKYRSRYLNLKSKFEIPLDLSVKPNSPVPTNTEEIANDVPMASTFTEVYTEPSDEPIATQVFSDSSEVSLVPISHGVYVLQETGVSQTQEEEAIVTITQIAKPITPPPTPTKRKHAVMLEEAETEKVFTVLEAPKAVVVQTRENPAKLAKTATNPSTKRDCTPSKPIKVTDTAPKTVKAQPPASKPTKNKATRKLKFDEETSSPVSGTIIRPLEDITDGIVQYSNGDIDPKYNIVEITEETKAELAAIKNVIGDYICKLCRLKFDDAFGLARHRCACIVLLEYRCPECGKQFNCPANLASHRRWHKPKKTTANSSATATSASRKENRNTTNNTAATQSAPKSTDQSTDLPFPCDICGKRFKRAAYLRKHQQTHNKKRTTSASANATAPVPTHEPPALVADGSISTASTAVMGAGSYQSYGGSTSSASSMHSYNGTTEEEAVVSYAAANGGYIEYVDDEDDVRSTTSSTNSAGYGRLQIVETGLTEEENIAAAALTNLRNCASVIQHTTLAH